MNKQMNKAEAVPALSGQHAPGPWRIWERGLGMFAVDSATRQICDIWSRSDENLTTARANARLIAAAPELLEALKDAVFSNLHTLGNSDEPGWLDKARAAIAKAEGRQS